MSILHIERVDVPLAFYLTLYFSDGDCRTVDVRPLLHGRAFERLSDPEYFASVAVDPVCKTVAWPCGADFAPEALRSLPSVDVPVAG